MDAVQRWLGDYKWAVRPCDLEPGMQYKIVRLKDVVTLTLRDEIWQCATFAANQPAKCGTVLCMFELPDWSNPDLPSFFVGKKCATFFFLNSKEQTTTYPIKYRFYTNCKPAHLMAEDIVQSLVNSSRSNVLHVGNVQEAFKAFQKERRA